MNRVIIFLICSLSFSALANDRELVGEVTNILDGITRSSGLPVQNCPEANDHKELIRACRALGVAKILSQARSFGVTLRPSDVKVCEIDIGFLSYYKHVWFCANTPRGIIHQMTQKPFMRECF